MASKSAAGAMPDSDGQSLAAASASAEPKGPKLPLLLVRQAAVPAAAQNAKSALPAKTPILPRGQAAVAYKAMPFGPNPSARAGTTAAASSATSPQLDSHMHSVASSSSPRLHHHNQQQYALMASPTMSQVPSTASPTTAAAQINGNTNTGGHSPALLRLPKSGATFPSVDSPQVQARRSTHLASEKKRRQNISNGFEDVRQAIETSYSSSSAKPNPGALRKTKGADTAKTATSSSSANAVVTNNGNKGDSKAQILRKAASRLSELSTELVLLRQLVFECDRCCGEYRTRRTKMVLDLPIFNSGASNSAEHCLHAHCDSTKGGERKVPIAPISNTASVPSKRRGPTRGAGKRARAANEDEDELMMSAATLTSLKDTVV